MIKKHPLLIIFAAGFILLLSGIGTSYYWLTRIYLPDQINSNENAKNLVEWTEADSFAPPVDNTVSVSQINKFLLVNESLYFLLQQLNKDYSESQWYVVFEMIKLQPEWQAKKYLALKKFKLSPLEHEFITEEITKYWIDRLKEKSAEHLKEMGWEILQNRIDSTQHSKNYELFNSKEDQLNNIFTLFLSQDVKNMFMENDTTVANSDSLP
jgi:hypothetical protein